MYNYRITARDREVIEEFRNKPIGLHSAGLQRVLNVLRGSPAAGRYAVIATKPGREWVIAELSPERGKPPKILRGRKYERLEDAEWEVFKRRWKKVTGESIE
jgi:hypothetical protein